MEVYSGSQGLMAAYGAVTFIAIIIIAILIIKYVRKSK